MITSPEADRTRLAGTRWDPGQYLRFGDQRLRPGLDLLARVGAAAPRRVVDLGCGTGALTRVLAERWPSAEVVGVDHSPQMLAEAGAAPSRVRWLEADLRDWSPEQPPDVIFSNATLQWVDDHEALIPRLLEALAPGGWLAVQMPLSWDAPSHRLMRATLADGGAGGAPLGPPELRAALERPWVAEPAWYHALLADRARDIDVWETTYLHLLEGEDPVLAWVSGTGLRPILAALGPADRDAYLGAYAARLRTAYPPRADGRTVFPFRRVFAVARAHGDGAP